ncbi:hypothetical protein EX30DRAFT_369375 [Ascodesmis nigricans]|uniref:RNase H type-1 domain-containing protein n=1 Tax=Ascodesmis nigricans TaxID=341454 RepID=A0A4S2N4L2_9PEZI|nr:hypothetical protein EX30DRAFT_369375 [Ascodesmis nigricans]
MAGCEEEDSKQSYDILCQRRVEIHLHWVPSHQDIIGNEVADKAAKEASTRKQSVTWKPSLAHIKRKINEARHQEEKQWFREKCQKYYPQRYKLRKSTRADPTAAKARKKIALQYYRFAADRAVTATYLKSIGKRESDECWWCDGPRQTREHLFKECRKWRREQEGLWSALRKDGFTRLHASSTIFTEPRATSAILTFIEETLVGRPKTEEEDRARDEREHEEWGWEEEEAESG